jgi:hypothetical protein
LRLLLHRLLLHWELSLTLTSLHNLLLLWWSYRLRRLCGHLLRLSLLEGALLVLERPTSRPALTKRHTLSHRVTPQELKQRSVHLLSGNDGLVLVHDSRPCLLHRTRQRALLKRLQTR